MNALKTLSTIAAVLVSFGFLFVYFGAFNIAADVPHSKPVYWLMDTARDRSIAVRARGIKAPALDDPAQIIAGAAEYAEMCSVCHLHPGVEESEMTAGMYPRPPLLFKSSGATPAQMFWTIKHGIKMSAMPAWGAAHDDRTVWAMVAFLKQLPRMSPTQYQVLTAKAEGESGDSHGTSESMPRKTMKPGMQGSEAGHDVDPISNKTTPAETK